MAKTFTKTSKEDLMESINEGAYNKTGNMLHADIPYVKLKPGTYIFRCLPAVSDDIFGAPTSKMAAYVPVHPDSGKGGREQVPCVNVLSGDLRVACPNCEEFSRTGAEHKSSKTTRYYYVNVVFISKHDPKDIQNYVQKGDKTYFKIHTLRLPKVQAYDPLAMVAKDAMNGKGTALENFVSVDGAPINILDLATGCAVEMTVTEKEFTIKGTTKKATFPQYSGIRIRPEVVADITDFIDVEDIPDLRVITKRLPSALAMKYIYNGTGIQDAMARYGSFNPHTKEVYAGSVQDAGAPQPLLQQAAPQVPNALPPSLPPVGSLPPQVSPVVPDIIGSTVTPPVAAPVAHVPNGLPTIDSMIAASPAAQATILDEEDMPF